MTAVAMRLGTKNAVMPERRFGAFELRRLDWDTNHFGQKMGVLALVPTDTRGHEGALARELRTALDEARDDGYAHVILRVPAESLAVARAAERSAMRLVDVAVDLATSLGPRQALPAVGPGVRIATAGDLDALRAIAESAFEFSRFASDPFFSSEQVAGFYRQWITNLCDGLAKIVLVAEAVDEIVGFSSCAVQPDGTGRIPLIATSEAHRRQGVGRSLIECSLRWFGAAGIRNVRVKTQAANYSALALYHRAGFHDAAAELTFSATLTGEGSIAL
jgi:ribosomal protein S18 acetylase RimI-like enzyme